MLQKDTKILQKQNILKIVFVSVFVLVFGAVAAFGVFVSLRTISSFDGSMNLQVPVNLAERGLYATDYPELKEFDRKIQTGPTVLMPIAFLFLLFGKSFFIANIVNLAYMLGTLTLAFIVVKRVTNKWIGLSVFLLLPMLPGFFSLGLNQYGEIPALFFLLAAVLLLERARRHTEWRTLILVLSGLALGCAVLTKTVILIALPSILILALADILRFKTLKLKHYLIVFLCMIAPLAIFELTKLAHLGLEDYQSLWTEEISKISQNAGVSADLKESQGSTLTTLSEHFSKLASILGVNTVFLFTFLVLPFAVAAQKLFVAIRSKKLSRGLYSYLIIAGVSLSYFGWWLILTPTTKTYPRRIFDGLVLQEILLIAAVGFLIVLAFKYKKIKRAFIVLLAMVGVYLMCFLLFNQKTDLGKYFDHPARRETVYRIAETIKNLPQDAVIYGTGWWQAPRLSFLSGRTFTSVNHKVPKVGPVHESYFVIDSEAYSISRGEMDKVLSWFDHELVDSGQGYFLYRLKYFTGPA